MAIVKIKFVNDAVRLEQYIFSHRSEDDPVSLENCIEGDVANTILYEQKLSRSRSLNQAIHIIQSWDKDESKTLSPEDFNEMGKELVSKTFPGYSYAIVTHADTEHVHNHIMLSPVHSETGVRIQNKKHHWYDLKDMNDEICIERGLKIVERGSKRSWDKKPDTVKEIEKRGGNSYIADLKEKAKFAASISTSFDEYGGVLNQFGIEVKIRGETLSYRYPNRTRFKRADKLGDRFDFKELKTKFELNDRKFVEVGLKLSTHLNKDYSSYHQFSRDTEVFKVPESEFKNLVVPIETIKRISESNIESYCQRFGIELASDGDGTKRLKDREYIRVEGSRWFNEKNKTSGNQLDFIVNSEGISYVNALSKAENNPILTEKLKNIESIKPSYKSFYVPVSPSPIKDSARVFSSFVKDNNFNSLTIKLLNDRGQIKIYGNDRFKFYPAKSRSKSISYYKSGPNKWFSRSNKGLASDLLSPKFGVKKLYLFSSPLDLISSKFSNKVIQNSTNDFQVAVPLEPIKIWTKKWKDSILGLDELIIVGSKSEDSFLKDLKAKSTKSISVEEFDQLISKGLNKQIER